MTYPNSSQVTAGQPTAASDYNNLRGDALFLGNNLADSLPLGTYLRRHVENFTIQIYSTTRLRVPYSVNAPATIMINGYMLQAAADVTLAAGLISGGAATWYIFAQRNAGSTTFTLSVNTSAVEPTDQRLVGECYFDGSSITTVTCYFTPSTQLNTADFDSGWFAVAAGQTYAKAHGLGQMPRLTVVLWSSNANGASPNVPASVVISATPAQGTYSPLYISNTNCTIVTGTGTSGACTLASMNYQSSAGYYRILAWK